MPKFKSGDVVMLKTGSPEMTVHGYRDNNETQLTCVWFDQNGRQSASFKEDTLQLDE